MKHVRESVLVMKMLCNPHRYAIMELLIASRRGLCVNQIADMVGVSQSLASHQLAYLAARGLIEGSRHGQTICYTLSKHSLTKKVAKVIKALS